MTKAIAKKKSPAPALANYPGLVGGIGELLDAARRASVRTVNAFMTATYWEVGRRIVEFEQGGEKRAGYGDELLDRLAKDLNSRLGRGFSRRNLQSMRQFYRFAPAEQIWQTLSAKSFALAALAALARTFPLPWSHYVLLIRRSSPRPRARRPRTAGGNKNLIRSARRTRGLSQEKEKGGMSREENSSLDRTKEDSACASFFCFLLLKNEVLAA